MRPASGSGEFRRCAAPKLQSDDCYRQIVSFAKATLPFLVQRDIEPFSQSRIYENKAAIIALQLMMSAQVPFSLGSLRRLRRYRPA